jgi:hypothetical protein
MFSRRFRSLLVLFSGSAALIGTGPMLSASSGTAQIGQSVTFSVTVNGTAPFTYQWYKDGSILPGAVGATHTITTVGVGDAGTYYVVVANAAGSTTSDNAVLQVVGRPPVAPDGATASPP